MILKSLSVLNYKNIEEKNLEFSPRINCFVGKNGVGKTNLLDAIYHLGITKSYFSSQNNLNMRHKTDFYLLDGLFFRENRQEQVVCSVKKGQKKVLKRNGKPYERITEHIGHFPIVIVSPADRNLITEGSEERRRFLDSLISQSNPLYLNLLVKYNHILEQRNLLLKGFAEKQHFDAQMLGIYDEQLAFFGEKIHQERADFLQDFIPIFQEKYAVISAEKESVHIQYESVLFEKDFPTLLLENQQKDCLVTHTTQGIHKDDLHFLMNEYSIKKYASQGQQKSFLIALKLAQFQIIQQKTNIAPLLLLDDIFDKLDDDRVKQLLELVSKESFGQIFLSDTHRERTEMIVSSVFSDYKIIEI